MWPLMQTPNRASLSIIGLYEWDDTIFNQLQIPTGVNADEVKENILLQCAELELLYPDWDFMYKAIKWWSKKELPTWNHIYEMAQLDYNPIENYDRIETELEMEDLNDKRTRTSESQSSSSGSSHNGTLNQVAGFNTDNLATQSGSTGDNTSQSSGEASMQDLDQGNSTRKNNRQSRIHGNIGVTTVAQMMAGELETYPKINIVEYIVQAFKERFCLLVY